MGKIYVGQTKLRFTATVSQVITGATCTINYIDPSGTTGSWAGVISDATAGEFYYDVASTAILNKAGKWTLYAHVVFSDTTIADGEPYTVHVYNPGE